MQNFGTGAGMGPWTSKNGGNDATRSETLRTLKSKVTKIRRVRAEDQFSYIGKTNKPLSLFTEWLG